MLAVSNGLLAAGIVIDLIISVVIGLAPLFYGRMRGRRTVGIVGFVATVIGGAALGFIVALIVAIVFLVAIWASSRTQRTRTTVAL